jgi:signal transduction histidine kinase
LANSSENFQADIDFVNNISIVPSLLEVVCLTTGMGFAAIARVTDKRWIACSVHDEINFGLKPGGELELETTICNEIRHTHEAVVIDDVSIDPVFRDHHTPKMYGFRSYISFPIFLQNGEFFGTLCAIDPKPAQINNPKINGVFKMFAELISFHLSTMDKLTSTEKKLSEEHEIGELREQFIAVLGHDLKNPVNAISNSSELLLRLSGDESINRLANVIKNSSFRMLSMIENILDFATGRLGGGIKLNYKPNEPLVKILNQVITELKTIWQHRPIEILLDLDEPVACDGNRIAQLFSNLLGNAFKYGEVNMPVKVEAISCNGEFILSVANACKKIPDNVLERIFQPFYRGEINPGRQGLGLGLYIASEIALAHNGRLDVISTDSETRFTFKMPCINNQD